MRPRRRFCTSKLTPSGVKRCTTRGPRSADLPRRRLRDEQVRALDRSAEDGPDMALRGRRSSSPGPRRRPKSMAVAGTDPRCDASGATLICKKFVNRAQGFQASGIFHRGGQEPRRGERGTVCDGRLAAKCALALAATSDYLRPVVSLTARSGYRPRSWGGRSGGGGRSHVPTKPAACSSKIVPRALPDLENMGRVAHDSGASTRETLARGHPLDLKTVGMLP
jgi:hypothetical protein